MVFDTRLVLRFVFRSFTFHNAPSNALSYRWT